MPGRDRITGKKCEKLTERIVGKRSLSERADLVQVQNGHFQNEKHGENDSIGTGLTKRRSGLWIHLQRSCEQKVMIVFLLGTSL